MLRRLANQLPLQQLSHICSHICEASALNAPLQYCAQLQLTASYSAKLNPKEQKRQQKSDQKKARKQTAGQPASADGEKTSFTDEGAAVEPDVTKLVLQAIHNVTPVLEVRQIRAATKVSFVPGLMPPRKARSLALHWLVKAAQARAESSKARFSQCLALELLLAYQKKGSARQKRDDIHKLALQNRANLHLRWW